MDVRGEANMRDRLLCLRFSLKSPYFENKAHLLSLAGTKSPASVFGEFEMDAADAPLCAGAGADDMMRRCTGKTNVEELTPNSRTAGRQQLTNPNQKRVWKGAHLSGEKHKSEH
jgi:hypothetical protein